MKDYKHLTKRADLLKSLHHKILNDKFANNVTEQEILALIDTYQKIEQGRLIELPCKVLDDFYFIGQYAKGGELTNNFEICSEQVSSFEYDGNITVYDTCGIDYCVDEIFFDKAEAEAKLAELRGGK